MQINKKQLSRFKVLQQQVLALQQFHQMLESRGWKEVLKGSRNLSTKRIVIKIPTVRRTKPA